MTSLARIAAVEWTGSPVARAGIYWLARRRDGVVLIGFYCRGGWRISDAIGRTRIWGAADVARLFNLVEEARPPWPEAAR